MVPQLQVRRMQYRSMNADITYVLPNFDIDLMTVQMVIIMKFQACSVEVSVIYLTEQ